MKVVESRFTVVRYLFMKNYQRFDFAKAIKQGAKAPKFELTNEQLDRIKSGSEILLSILAVAGAITLAAAAPNAIQAFSSFAKRSGQGRILYKDKLKRVTKSFYYLKNKRYVEVKPKDNDFNITLTDKGKRKIEALRFETMMVPKSNWWDGRFWQVAADIPTKQFRAGADALRKKLKQMGFYSLQRTLWFYPFDPRKEVEVIAENHKIERFVTVMKIAKMDRADEKVLWKYFHEAGIL